MPSRSTCSSGNFDGTLDPLDATCWNHWTMENELLSVLEDCSRPGGPSCSRTRPGGCGNYNTQTLSREFKDRAYSTQQCHVLCKETDECGGFFFGTSTKHCLLVRSGCTPTEDANWDYYSMDDCAYPTYAIGEKGRGAQGCPAGYGWVANGEMCEEGLNYLKIHIQSVSSSSANACYKDNLGKGYNDGNDGVGASYICKLYEQ